MYIIQNKTKNQLMILKLIVMYKLISSEFNQKNRN